MASSEFTIELRCEAYALTRMLGRLADYCLSDAAVRAAVHEQFGSPVDISKLITLYDVDMREGIVWVHLAPSVALSSFIYAVDRRYDGYEEAAETSGA